ncbi:MAG: methyltransferase [Desulfomonilia bacterium]|nr:methyltransferase [Desulfomonilia bacterium]
MPWTNDPSEPREDETLDTLSCSHLSILQKRTGYRYSLDAYLLAAFVDEKPAAEVVDIGSGSGILSILLAAVKGLHVTGVEVQEDLADMSTRSVMRSGLQDKVRIICGDVRTFKGGKFDAVVTNPPYRPLATGRLNPGRNRAIARHELMLDLDGLLKSSYELLAASGRFYIVYPAWRFVDLVTAMRSHRIEPKRCMFVHSTSRSNAELCLLSGLRDGGKELIIERAFHIYSDEGSYTSEMNAVFTALELPKSH